MAEQITIPPGFKHRAGITDAQIHELVALHEQGLGRNAIMRETGHSAETVTYTLRDLGLTFDRAKVRAATAAKVADAKNMRAALQIRLLEEGEARLDELSEPTLVFSFGGRDNIYRDHTLDRPTVEQKLKLTQAASTAITQALKLAEFDQGDGADEGRSLIGALADKLGVRGPQVSDAG